MTKLSWNRALFLYFLVMILSVNATMPEVGSLPLSEVAGEPSALIGGCVNAVTGTYSEQQTDVLLLGAEPLVFQRYYNSSDWSGGYLCDGWGHNFGCWAQMQYDGNNYCQILFPHLSGGGTLLQGNQRARDTARGWSVPKTSSYFSLNNDALEIGLTNCGNGVISGRTNIKNMSIELKSCCTALASPGDGSMRTFGPAFDGHQKLLKNLTLLTLCDRKPSGNTVYYGYDNNRRINRLETKNAIGKLLNWIEFDYGNRKMVNVRTSEGKTIQYRTIHLMKKGENSETQGRFRLSEVINPGQPTIYYQYSGDKNTHEQMVRRAGPDGRFLEVSYWGRDVKPKHVAGRVCDLRAPVGTDATSIATHRFNYPTEDSTEVWDALNHKKFYQFTKKRLTQITHYTGTTTYVPYYSDKFYWGNQGSIYRSDLVCRALLDGTGAVRSCRTLDYDQAHNVTAEILWGNLSGMCLTPPMLDAAGRSVENGCEHVTTRYTYSTDRFNLLLSECEENGRTTFYGYQPNTDLLTCRLISDGRQIVSREFHTYNEDGIRVRSVTDDGCGREENDLTGVTARCIDIIQPRMEMPGIGMPLSVEHRYLDIETGTERQLNHLVNHYNKELWLVKQDYYDAEDQLRYSLTREYDAMGNVTAETDALGQITQRRFDANSNKIYEQKPENAFATYYQYDFVNRCIYEEQVYSDGSKRAHTFKYDILGQKVSEVNFMGHETRYVYDALGRVIETHSPESEDGSIVIRQEYDIAGNVIASIDGNGNRKEMSYTVRGKVAEIRYPDGSCERSVYNRDGTLARATATNGLETVYTYDTLGNVILKEHLDLSGSVLSVTSAVYKGNRLLSETDANGNTTSYTYDGAGRQTGIYKHDSHTEVGYDALGRRHMVSEWSDCAPMQCRVTHTTTDLLGRVLEETVEDGNACLLKVTRYAYDTFGNRTEVTQVTGTEKGVATTMTDYDADHRPVHVTDPLGNVTVIEYDDIFRNSLGQRVLQTRTTDALGNQTWITKNALGQVSEELRKNAWGAITAKRQHRHDGNGNVTETIETVIVDGASTRDIATQFTYDSMNRNTSTTEAVGTHEQRTTHQSYNGYGQQEAVLLPDGLSLHFVYDGAGRLLEYYSRDESINYRYHYDANGNVIQVDNRKESTTTLRTYDASNRIETETLGNGITLCYRYDGFGRMLQLTLPDQSGIRYTYNPLLLETVERIGQRRETRYTHAYNDYDLTGHAARTVLVGNAGEVAYKTDLMGRSLTMTSAHVSEVIHPSGYDAVGNLLEKQLRDPMGTVKCRYGYDSLYQLTQESGVSQHQYRYDSLNNRLAKDADSYQVNSLNELQQAGSTTYQYDRRGCRIGEEGEGRNITYRYDALNRLIEIDTPDRRHIYTYDSFNRRLTATTLQRSWTGWTESRRRFLYVGQNEIGAMDESGELVELRLLGTGRGAEIGATVAVELAGAVYAALSDSSGHLVAIINASNGAFAEGYRYSAFGEVTTYNNSWWPFNRAQTGNPWQFSGKRVDKDTGFVVFGRRYYDPALGRWITPDPLGFKAGPNLYAYVMNNPLTHFDLYGLFALSDFDYGGGRRLSQFVSRQAAQYAMGTASRIYNYGHSIGRSVKEFSDSIYRGCNASGSDYFVIPGIRVPGVRVAFCNGIDYTPSECMHLAKYISRKAGGYEVHCVYNCTDGKVGNLVRQAKMAMGLGTKAVDIMTTTLSDLYKQASAESLNPRLYTLGHSQGASVIEQSTGRLSDNVTRCMRITTFGPTDMVRGPQFGGATNIVDEGDCWSKLSRPIQTATLGLLALGKMHHPNVQYIKSDIPGHGASTTYAEAISDWGDSFQEMELGVKQL